ncbi:MAG: hypothetical protein HXX11_21940 [Desulfuromonadales bacterium]|nr:hypothetical protein [Desulfuromonadales bacterium]
MDHPETPYIDIKTLAEAWLPASALKNDLLNKCKAIAREIKAGKFKSARQIPATRQDGRAKGRGGKIWEISLSDPVISG